VKKDLNEIASLEKAISQKYGADTVVNPKSTWDAEREEDYIEQLKKVAKSEAATSKSHSQVELNGFLLSRKLINKRSERVCPVCDTYSFSKRDDLYMNRFECCLKCYINFVEDREERWATGWRPEKLEKNRDD
tara:strand:- start:1908 stop:2306 length:399 start_codon:yes stop_codon:yes gene_type:complete